MSTTSIAVPRPRGSRFAWGRLPTSLRYALIVAALVGIW
jgi:hypothetical protein